MNKIKELGQQALWAITGSPGARYVRELRADALGLSRPRQCQAFGVSVWATDDELEAARLVWLDRLPIMAEAMDLVGATTPEEAIAKINALKARADRAEHAKAEIARIQAEMKENRDAD